MTVIRFGFARFPLDVPIPPDYADSSAVPADLAHFWQALVPAMHEVIAHHPVRQGRGFVPHKSQQPADYPPDAVLSGFQHYITELDPSQKAYRYKLYDQRTERDQSYAVWFLQELYDYIAGPGFGL